MAENSPRYFYTDPLAAAWMAKHFGMRITIGVCESFDPTWSDIAASGNGVPFYIHPDSVRLLSCQIGDLVSTEGYTEGEIVNYDPELFDIRHRVIRILQRKGIAFMWPEKEQA